MRFRGVTSLHQVGGTEGHNFGVGEQEVRPEGPRAGVVGEGEASLPFHQLGRLGERYKLRQWGPWWRGFLAFCATRLPLLARQLRVELFMPI